MLIADYYPLAQDPQLVAAQPAHADEEAELLGASPGVEEFDLKEHADINFFALLLWHLGHSGASPQNTRASNSLWQSSHIYSYIGILFYLRNTSL